VRLFIAKIFQDYSDTAGAPSSAGLHLVHSENGSWTENWTGGVAIKMIRAVDGFAADGCHKEESHLRQQMRALIVLARPEMQDCASPSAYAEQTALVPKESRDNELRSTESRARD